MKKDSKKRTIDNEVDLSRRKFLLGGVGLLIAGGIGASLIEPRKAHAETLGALPKPDPSSGQIIPVDLVKKIAWRYYGMASGCCNCTSSALIEGIKYAFGAAPTVFKFGDPPTTIYVPGDLPAGNDGEKWNYVPTGINGWFKYGGGGIQHWGTICGVPNGASIVLSLMGYTKTLQPLVDQVMMRYSQTRYPTKDEELYDLWKADNDANPTECAKWWGSKQPLPENMVLGFSTSNSPLCHVAISKWSWAANTDLMSSQGSVYYTNKVDRCAKACADVAGFLAELLNNTPTDTYEIPHDTEACYDCHHPNAGSVIPAQQGHMDCGECHTDLRAHAVTGYPPTVGHTPDPVNVVGMEVSFNDASTDNNGNNQDTLRVEINWGDGGMSNGVGGGAFSHTYTASGKYTITHSVQDSGGRFSSEIIKAAVGMYDLTVHVIQDGFTALAGATVYLKQKKGSGDWKQIMYGYTDDAGSKTYTDLPGTGYQYKVVVYKSGFDFNTSATGTQTKVASTAFSLTADTTVTIQQGGPPVVTIT